jgi:hypothetical protein
MSSSSSHATAQPPRRRVVLITIAYGQLALNKPDTKLYYEDLLPATLLQRMAASPDAVGWDSVVYAPGMSDADEDVVERAVKQAQVKDWSPRDGIPSELFEVGLVASYVCA